jgi:hypothetical protein
MGPEMLLLLSVLLLLLEVPGALGAGRGAAPLLPFTAFDRSSCALALAAAALDLLSPLGLEALSGVLLLLLRRRFLLLLLLLGAVGGGGAAEDRS